MKILKYGAVLLFGSILGAAIPVSVAHYPCSPPAPPSAYETPGQKVCNFQNVTNPYTGQSELKMVCE